MDSKLDLFDYLSDSLPSDHCRQTRAINALQAELQAGFRPKQLLDFGCGDGRTLPLFKQLIPEADWLGVDIEDSPEVRSRLDQDRRFLTYNGIDLPFSDAQFDLIYSHQVLEHVRYPELVLKEISRVLRSDGLFVDQTSQFEPYHSYSLWNFTIYGFKKIVEDAGLKLLKLRSAIDGFTLMERTYRGRPKEFDRFAHEESPRNVEIEQDARQQQKSIRVVNFRKLLYAGSFSFVVGKRT